MTMTSCMWPTSMRVSAAFSSRHAKKRRDPTSRTAAASACSAAHSLSRVPVPVGGGVDTIKVRALRKRRIGSPDCCGQLPRARSDEAAALAALPCPAAMRRPDLPAACLCAVAQALAGTLALFRCSLEAQLMGQRVRS